MSFTPISVQATRLRPDGSPATGTIAFATKSKSWDITEVDNGDGTVTLYADAEFEPVSQVCECCGQRLASDDQGETP